jgi:hypothetical protein
LADLEERLAQLTPVLRKLPPASQMLPPMAQYPGYRDDPLGYIADILRVHLTPGQQQVVEALQAPPRKVLVSSGHSVGKSTLGACLVNWWFDTRYPSLCLTTAPTDRQVKDILWREVRVLRERAGLPEHFAGPKIPRLETAPDHFAHGFTARDGTRFQGHHSPGGLLVIFDEAEGVEEVFWQSLKTMLDDESAFVAFYNPTSPGSACHQREQQADSWGAFRRLTLSCLEHPNVEAQLHGGALVIPGAITLQQLRDMLLEDSMLLTERDAPHPGDVELGGQRYRPGPIAEARCLGRRPQSATAGVWSEELWKRVAETRLDIDPAWPVAIGCDVARYGDDATVMMVRKGVCLLHAETHLKQSTAFTAQRLRELCVQYADGHNVAQRIPCLIDEGGVGSGVIDQAGGYQFVPVNASCRPRRTDRFLNVRAELWFSAREPALRGLLDVSRLPQAYQLRLKAELLAARYRVKEVTGLLQVTSKEDMKSILKRSPDVADAFNLALYPPGVVC